jgi:type IV pilus assembly protein PilF
MPSFGASSKTERAMRHDLRTVLMLLGMATAACSSPQIMPAPESSTTPKKSLQKTERTPQESAAIWVQLGQHYLELGKFEIAREDLQKALKFDPKSVDAHTVLATLYDRVGDQTSAELHYRAAADLSPTGASANNNYGLYLCKLGRFDQAQKRFDIAKADGFYTSRDIVYLNSGTCILLAKGSKEAAEADFRRAIEVNPNNGQALFQLASVLYDKNDFFKARAFIQRFDALGQPSPDALLLARNIEVKLGNNSAAHDYAQRLREQFPDASQTHSLDAASTP